MVIKLDPRPKCSISPHGTVLIIDGTQSGQAPRSLYSIIQTTMPLIGQEMEWPEPAGGLQSA